MFISGSSFLPNQNGNMNRDDIQRNKINLQLKIKKFQFGTLAELDYASIIHPRDPGSNFDISRKIFLILILLQLNYNL
jgi:hypothetical protein